MLLPRPGDHGFTGSEFLFLSCNMKQSAAAQNEINFIRFRVAVNPLILSRFQAIQIAEVFRRLKHRQLLHLLIRETNEIVDLSNIHIAE